MPGGRRLRFGLSSWSYSTCQKCFGSKQHGRVARRHDPSSGSPEIRVAQFAESLLGDHIIISYDFRINLTNVDPQDFVSPEDSKILINLINCSLSTHFLSKISNCIYRYLKISNKNVISANYALIMPCLF
jgi:hypothetical protein